MKRSVLLLVVLLATRAALGGTCGGFSIVTADHVIVKYSAPLPLGATLSPPTVSLLGTNVTVSRNISGGSAVDVTCVDDRVDLGYLGAGRFNLTWIDNANFSTQRSTFAFVVGAPATGYVGDLIDVLPPALPDRPVRLEVNTCSRNPAVAYVSGNDIYVSEYQGEKTTCKISVLDLGILPSGTYNVRGWGVPLQFIVQQPAPTSACSGRSFVTRTPAETVRLHFEEPYRGYTPTFGPPTVTAFVDWPPGATVVQPVADTANAYTTPPPPYSTVCHAEELDLGPITDNGYHEVWWWDQISVGGFQSFSWGTQFSFYWMNGSVQCTSDGELLTPSVHEGAPSTVTLNLLHLGWQTSYPKPRVDGHTITVDIQPFFFGPGDWLPSCQTFGAKLDPLPAGEYTVVWHIGNRVATSHLTVVKPTRQRAARH